jgi:hypothetical protein
MIACSNRLEPAHVISQMADVEEPRGGSTSGLFYDRSQKLGGSLSDQYLAITATGALPQLKR